MSDIKKLILIIIIFYLLIIFVFPVQVGERIDKLIGVNMNAWLTEKNDIIKAKGKSIKDGIIEFGNNPAPNSAANLKYNRSNINQIRNN